MFSHISRFTRLPVILGVSRRILPYSPQQVQYSSDQSTKIIENVKSTKKMKNSNSFTSPISWKSLAVTAIAAGGLWYYFEQEKKKHASARKAKDLVSVGRPKIGGPFNLIDHNGHAVTDQDFLGKFLLIYFGFTFCPDVCPEELTKIAHIVDAVSQKNPQLLQPIFISIDPKRDDVAAIKKYINEFHPKFIGLTGTPDQIAQAAKAYRVYFSAPPNVGDDDYIVDHSIITYLVDPNGNFVDYYGQQVTVEDASKSILQHMSDFGSQTVSK